MSSKNITFYLERFNKLSANIHIVFNEFIWDESGRTAGAKEPLIHVFNKDYGTIKRLPIYQEIQGRKNAILLGDSVDDAQMLDGFNGDNFIKIGFLDENPESWLAEFKNNYDIIILDNGSLNYVLDFCREVCGRL